MNARKLLVAGIIVMVLLTQVASIASADDPTPIPNDSPQWAITATPTPTATPTSTPTATPTPTPTGTATPTPTNTPTSTPTPTPDPACGNGSWLITGPVPLRPILGGEFTNDLQFTINALSCPGMTAAEVYIHYDPTIIDPVDIPGVGVAEILPDFFGASSFSVNEVTNQCDSVSSPCLHIVVAGPPQYNKTGSAIRPHWRCKTLGTAVFTGRATFVDADGFNIPVNNPVSAQAACSALAIKGRVLRQGVLGNQAGTTVAAVGNAYTFTSTTDINGNFIINNLPEGSYTVRASYPGYLNAERLPPVTVSLGNPVVDVGTTRLWGGEVNGDCRINILDIGQIISKFGMNGFPPSDPTDINDDGLVNVSDLAIAAGNWNKICPTAWLP